MNNINRKLEELKNELAAQGFELGKDWNGYQVYIPQYSQKTYVGLPFIVLVKGDEVRVSTVEESMDYLEFKNKKIVQENRELGEHMKEKIICAVCGTNYMGGQYDDCPVCDWEYDGCEQNEDGSFDYNWQGPNPIILGEARKLFAEGKNIWGEPLKKQ